MKCSEASSGLRTEPKAQVCDATKMPAVPNAGIIKNKILNGSDNYRNGGAIKNCSRDTNELFYKPS
jgi:hypothetical protein